MVRFYGEPKHRLKEAIIHSVDFHEKQLLIDKIKMLEQQVQQASERESWLKSQVEQAQATIKLLEYKQPQKKGIFGRVLEAINNG